MKVDRFGVQGIRLYESVVPHEWKLELLVSYAKAWSDTQLTVQLDDSMRATPPAAELDQVQSTKLGASLIPVTSLSTEVSKERARKLYHVSPNQSLVTMRLPRTDVDHTVRIEVEFRFIKLRPPDKIFLSVDLRNTLGRMLKFVFEGLYLGIRGSVRHSLVDFMISPADRFLFSEREDALILPHDWVSDVAPIMQRRQTSIVWGTTWHDEMPFWNSAEGVDFLAYQVIDLELGGGASRRIAISPYGLGAEVSTANNFLAEMEAQALLGVDVHVLEPDHLFEELSNLGQGLLCLGENMAAFYSNIIQDANSPTSAKVLFGDEAREAKSIYDPVQNTGVPLKDFLNANPLPPQYGQYVRARVRLVRARVAEIRSGTDTLRSL